MSEITFNYKGNEIVIPCKKNETFGPILQRFYEKAEIQKKSIYFLFNGQILDEQMNESQVPKNENNKKIIVVYDYQTTKTNEEDILVRANEIVCPKCKESACISLNNYSISLFQCCNGHKVDNISFEDFDNTQNINLSSIICQICKIKNKGNVDNNEFFRCINCKCNLCPLCRSAHDKSHYIINYEQKNCICEEHGEPYASYCKTCKKDICISCDEKHDDHEIEFYQKMRFKKEQIKDNIIDLKMNIDQLNQIINDFIEKLNKVKNMMEMLYEINDIIYKTTNSKFRNYNKLININFINNNDIKKDIQNIINESDINNKITKIIKIYKKVINPSELDSNISDEPKLVKKRENSKEINKYIIHNSMKELCTELVEKKMILTEKIYNIMMEIDRSDFAPTNPYQNRAQPIPCNLVISSPELHSYCLEALRDHLKPGSTALDVGFGSGYLTVAMSKMMNDKGCVVGIDIKKEIYEFGKKNISKHFKKLLDDKKIELVLGDAKLGYKKMAPYKCIHVGVSAIEPPPKLLEQLEVGGRLVMPLGKTEEQYIYLIDKLPNGKFEHKKGVGVCYTPLI